MRVRERETETETERQTERQRERERELGRDLSHVKYENYALLDKLLSSVDLMLDILVGIVCLFSFIL